MASSTKRCVICGSSTSVGCANCGRPYCSKTCQKIDWKEKGHKYECKQQDGSFEGVGASFKPFTSATKLTKQQLTEYLGEQNAKTVEEYDVYAIRLDDVRWARPQVLCAKFCD